MAAAISGEHFANLQLLLKVTLGYTLPLAARRLSVTSSCRVSVDVTASKVTSKLFSRLRRAPELIIRLSCQVEGGGAGPCK